MRIGLGVEMVVSRMATVGLSFLSFCALLVSSGCGPGLGSPVKVSGTVTVDDKPLANAAITLNCTEERPIEYKAFNATTGSDGTYEIAKVYPGPYEVIVGESAEGLEDPGMAGATAPETLQPVSGELKTQVGSDDLVYDIKLKKGR
jgi:hypothetical protein